ncbi:hypothetical protein NUACC21_62820 [Scytonema sp. NUACC21]
MLNSTLPKAIQDILEKHSEPDAVFTALLPVLGEVLQCDRCFLYLRNPKTKLWKIPYCWRRNQEIPDMTIPDWESEPASLPEKDPLFAAALRTDPSVYVEDVETASPEVVNREFERKNLGHRALIHSHLVWNGELWGILQPCVFGRKREWSAFDRAVVTELENKLAPLAAAYIKETSVGK